MMGKELLPGLKILEDTDPGELFHVWTERTYLGEIVVLLVLIQPLPLWVRSRWSCVARWLEGTE